MKVLLCVSALLAVIGSSVALECASSPHEPLAAWKSMKGSCIKKMREQVRHEVAASMQYLAMAAHFSKDTINRPGFAKIFFESAGEERQHAIKIIEYLLMRGELIKDLSDLIKIEPHNIISSFDSGLAALQEALILESKVTNNILDVIKACEVSMDAPTGGAPKKVKEPFNDYHLVDYLTGDFLEEQYHGQKVFADRISTLGKMRTAYGDLSEFLFDKQLLSSE